MEELRKRIQLLKDEIVFIENKLNELEQNTSLTISNPSHTSKATIKWNGGIDSVYTIPNLDIVTSGTFIVSESVQSGSLNPNTLIKATIDGQPVFLLASKATTP
jgi:hypothetical protein